MTPPRLSAIERQQCPPVESAHFGRVRRVNRRHAPYVTRMVSNDANGFGADDWAWAVEAIIAELAPLDPELSCAVAQRLAARLGYVEADPIDQRRRLMRRLAERLCTAALNRAA
jgi:hypothetical protein